MIGIRVIQFTGSDRCVVLKETDSLRQLAAQNAPIHIIARYRLLLVHSKSRITACHCSVFHLIIVIRVYICRLAEVAPADSHLALNGSPVGIYTSSYLPVRVFRVNVCNIASCYRKVRVTSIQRASGQFSLILEVAHAMRHLAAQCTPVYFLARYHLLAVIHSKSRITACYCSGLHLVSIIRVCLGCKAEIAPAYRLLALDSAPIGVHASS